MLIGYARVSTPDQSLDLQRDALLAVGCDSQRLYTDIASGTKADRPGLEAALGYMREGDTLGVWKLDRLGRSLKHLIETVHALDARGVGFKSLQEHIDTTTSGGKLVFHVFAALAEFERDLIGERTRAGLKAARARGRTGGRKRALTAPQIALAKSMKADPGNSIADICATLGISKRTLYCYTGS
jgi:DNA invertase Pin-like site-specific DNA recombinase